MRKSVLWVEDGAIAEAKEFTIPVYNSGAYDLTIALTITDAIREMQARSFNAVVVDIRMEPGDLEPWKTLHSKAGNNKGNARLGLKFLHSLFRKGHDDIPLPPLKQEIALNRFGVLSIENSIDIEKEFPEFKQMIYKRKSVQCSKTVLLELVEAILKNTDLKDDNI
jgi:hypothetical protein